MIFKKKFYKKHNSKLRGGGRNLNHQKISSFFQIQNLTPFFDVSEHNKKHIKILGMVLNKS